MELQGKRVLVTGASRGIGRELATHFARAGAKVALVARDAASLEALAKDLGGTAHPTDLGQGAQLDRLLDRVEDEAGPVDVLVNNAASAAEGALWKQTGQELSSRVWLNLVVPLELCRQAVPRMLERGGGHLVNVASLAALASVPGMTAYAATKAGLAHGASALRDELKGLPIGVTTVLVGGVRTELLEAGESYEPFHRSFERLRKIQLVPDTPVEVLAAAVVLGVEQGKRTVWVPKRALPLVAAVEAPRKIVSLALTGIKRRA
ncbi:MAG: SDR family NAD(P)-dependent oxidoreductase [Acidimicrobiales bacterium]|nr:SDR family NAD(P)-dependent oxidoreductase [Acidimicrobiales bacterium]